MPIDITNTPRQSQTVVPWNCAVISATVPILNVSSRTIVARTEAQSGSALEIRHTSMNAKHPRYCHAARLIISVTGGR